MKCTCCGRELSQNDRFCPECGENNENYVEVIEPKQYSQPQQNQYVNQPINRVPIYPNSNTQTTTSANSQQNTPVVVYSQTQVIQTTTKRKGMTGVHITAGIFMILGSIVMALTYYGIPLLWCIPMTVVYFVKASKGEKVSTAFKVCSIIFVSMIGGIIMFAAKDE